MDFTRDCKTIRLLNPNYSKSKKNGNKTSNDMITTPTPPSKTLSIANHLLNKSVKKKFGNEITIRINSLRFMDNRLGVTSYISPKFMTEEINLKSLKRLSLNYLKLINEFLFHQLNNILITVKACEYEKFQVSNR